MSLNKPEHTDSSISSDQKGSPELADFKRRRFNVKAKQNTVESPLIKADAGVDGLFDRLQGLLVDWNQKKSPDGRGASSVERTQIQPTSLSSLGTSFELQNLKAIKRRGIDRPPSDSHVSILNDDPSPRNRLKILQEESNEISKLIVRDDFSNNDEQQMEEHNSIGSIEQSRFNFRSTINNEKSILMASAPVQKLKPTLLISTNSNDDYTHKRRGIDCIRPSTTTAQTTESSCPSSFLSKLNSPKQTSDVSMSDLDLKLRANLQKQLRAESKNKEMRRELSGSPMVRSAFMKAKGLVSPEKRDSPMRSPVTLRLSATNSNMSLSDYEKKLVKSKLSKTAKNKDKEKQVESQISPTGSIIDRASSIDNTSLCADRLPQKKTPVKKLGKNSTGTPVKNRKSDKIDSLIANVSIFHNGKKIEKSVGRSERHAQGKNSSPYIKTNKGSFVEAGSTRLPTEKEESMTKESEHAERLFEKLNDKSINERPKTTGNPTNGLLSSKSSTNPIKFNLKLPQKERSDSTDSHKDRKSSRTDRGHFTLRMPRSTSRSSSMSIQKDEMKAVPKTKKKVPGIKVKSKAPEKTDDETKKAQKEKTSDSAKKASVSKAKDSGKSILSDSSFAQKTTSPSATVKTNPEPQTLLVSPTRQTDKPILKEKSKLDTLSNKLPNSGTALANSSTITTPIMKKTKKTNESSVASKQLEPETLSPGLTNISSKSATKKEKANTKDLAPQSNAQVSKTKSSISEGTRKTVLDYALKNDSVLKASNDLFHNMASKENKAKKNEEAETTEVKAKSGSMKQNDLSTPRSAGITSKTIVQQTPSSSVASRASVPSAFNCIQSKSPRNSKSFKFPGTAKATKA